jgi:PadR family transcriptional regulator, regulatory protein PadR
MMCKDTGCRETGCNCPGGKTERFIQPCLLLALRKHPSYGYELLEKMIEFGFLDGPVDPGMVYRHLRKLEQDGFVSSTWDASGTGPARRYYDLTPEGEDLLGNWIPFMERNLKSLERFLHLFQQTPSAKGGKANVLRRKKVRMSVRR